VEGEEIYALDFVTKDVKDGLKGKKTDEEIMGTMDINMSGGNTEVEGEGGGGGGIQGLQNLGDGKVPFLGVSLTRPEEKEIRITAVLEGSPAEHAGLKIGDKILQMEDYVSQDLGNDAWKLLEHLQEMPFDRPIRFHIERDKKRFDVWVKLERMEKEQLDKILQALRPVLNGDLSQGKQLLRQNKFAEAVKSFKKSLKSNPMESYQGLGISYYHMEKFKDARKNIEKAYKLDRTVPLNVFYTAACQDVLGKWNTAIRNYIDFLEMNYDNSEMNEFARERIAELKAKNRKRMSESFVKMIDAIIKEIKK
jgi:tetratricopeptide (TPR) repeat protein